MNLNHLRSFVSVAECLSFSKAAQRLHVRILEGDLDAKLFVRNRRTVSLSAVGKDILGDVERLLSDVDEIKQRVRRVSKGALGTLRIGFVASATPEIIPRMTISFRKHYPDVKLELKNLPTVQQVDAIRQRMLDVGVVRLPLREPDIEVFPLSSEPFAIAFAKTHPLRLRPGVGVVDLQQEAFISYSERLAPAFFQHWT
jgi:DNA-binding transcriptional LysR family regulator